LRALFFQLWYIHQSPTGMCITKATRSMLCCTCVSRTRRYWHRRNNDWYRWYRNWWIWYLYWLVFYSICRKNVCFKYMIIIKDSTSFSNYCISCVMVRHKCGRSWIRVPVRSKRRLYNWFFAKHAALRSKNKDWLARTQSG
jgi:hypothetical protein